MPKLQDAPSFKIALEPEELGQLFIDTARGIVTAAGPQQSGGAVIERAVNTAALFVETIADIQRKQ